MKTWSFTAKLVLILLLAMTDCVLPQAAFAQQSEPGEKQASYNQDKNTNQSPELADFSGGLKPQNLPKNASASQPQIASPTPQVGGQNTSSQPSSLDSPTDVSANTGLIAEEATDAPDNTYRPARPIEQRGQPQLDATSMVISLLFVLVVIWVLALLMKKFNMMPGAQSRAIKVIASQHLGTKEKLVVVEINEQQHVLGVTPHSINMITTLEQPIAAQEHGVNPNINPLSAKLANYFNQKSNQK